MGVGGKVIARNSFSTEMDKNRNESGTQIAWFNVPVDFLLLEKGE